MSKEEYTEIKQEEDSGASLKVVELINDFLDEFFLDEHEILRFNINFLESNGFEFQTNIDYMRLNRFVGAAYNTILANDFRVIDILISKFYKDIVYLNSFYKKFIEKSKEPLLIYKNIFLKHHKGVSELAKIVYAKEKNSKKLTIEDYDNLDEYMKEEFLYAFEKDFDSYKEYLKTIINTKTYYFDKLLWKEAAKSASIQDFFKKSKREEEQLTEELSTKIFIKQYLQTVDLSHTKNPRWHEYLEKVIGIMD